MFFAFYSFFSFRIHHGTFFSAIFVVVLGIKWCAASRTNCSRSCTNSFVSLGSVSSGSFRQYIFCLRSNLKFCHAPFLNFQRGVNNPELKVLLSRFMIIGKWSSLYRSWVTDHSRESAMLASEIDKSSELNEADRALKYVGSVVFRRTNSSFFNILIINLPLESVLSEPHNIWRLLKSPTSIKVLEFGLLGCLNRVDEFLTIGQIDITYVYDFGAYYYWNCYCF